MKVAVGLRRVAAGKRTSGRRAAQIALRQILRPSEKITRPWTKFSADFADVRPTPNPL